MKTVDDIRLEAYRLSERHLEAQTNAALAADQRAMSVAGLALAAAAILCGLSANSDVKWALLLGAVLLTLTAGLAWHSARPIDFYMPGMRFGAFKDDISSGRDATDLLAELGKYNDISIETNEMSMDKNACLMKWAFRCAISGILLAILPQVWQSL